MHLRSPDFLNVPEIAREALVPVDATQAAIVDLMGVGEVVAHDEWPGFYAVPRAKMLPLRHGMHYPGTVPDTYSYVDRSKYGNR